MITLGYHEWLQALVKVHLTRDDCKMNTPSVVLEYPPHIAAIKPYIPGLPIVELADRLKIDPNQIAKLASNENPLGASPRALEALASSSIDVSKYPDNDCVELVSVLAQFHDVPSDWIVVGAGSESVIGNAVSTILSVGRKSAYSQYSFQAYANSAQRVGAVSIVVPSPDFLVDLEGLQRAHDQSPSLVYIANPGNPTGTCLEPDALKAYLLNVPSNIVVLLDEAYFEFLPSHLQMDSIALVRALPNLLVTRTFSKAYGLAGLRVGYGVAQPALAEMLRRTRAPFSISQPAQLAATAALKDQPFLNFTLENNLLCKSMLAEGLRKLGLRYLDSYTNFILVEVGDGSEIAKRLEQFGLIVRPVNSYGLSKWLRISVGKAEEIQRLLDAMSSLMQAPD